MGADAEGVEVGCGAVDGEGDEGLVLVREVGLLAGHGGECNAGREEWGVEVEEGGPAWVEGGGP